MRYTVREMGKDRFLLRIRTFGTVYTSATNESFYYQNAGVHAVNICEIYIKNLPSFPQPSPDPPSTRPPPPFCLASFAPRSVFSSLK